MDEAMHDFFTSASILTFAGASAAVYVFSQVAYRVRKKHSAIVNLGIAIIVSLVGSYAAHTLKLEVVSIFLAALNGGLLFLTAAGGQEGLARSNQTAGETEAYAAAPMRWYSSWFR